MDRQTYFCSPKAPVGSKNVHVMEKTSLACPICLWMCLGRRMSLWWLVFRGLNIRCVLMAEARDAYKGYLSCFWHSQDKILLCLHGSCFLNCYFFTASQIAQGHAQIILTKSEPIKHLILSALNHIQINTLQDKTIPNLTPPYMVFTM